MKRSPLLCLFAALAMLGGMIIPSLPVSSPAAMAAFSDVPANHPYRQAIDYVQAQGIVGGFPDGSYQPDAILERAAFTKIIMLARFSSSVIDDCVRSNGFYQKPIFSDVESGVWFEKYVCLAKKKGIIGGFPDGTFRGPQQIIFAEAAKIAAESYGLSVGAGDPWFAPYLDALSAKRAVPDSLSAISDTIQRGIKPITRGEMADIIFRMSVVQDTISSPDGTFSITIPETALPAGVSTSDIKVSLLQGSDTPVEEVNGAPMLFYKLEPDGLKFRQPVDFRVSAPTLGDAVPLVFTISEDEFEMLPEPMIALDKSRNTASITGQISHFSFVAITFADLLNISLDEPGNQLVNRFFTIESNVGRTAEPNTFTVIGDSREITISDDWSLTDGWFQDVEGTLFPHQLPNNPDEKDYTLEDTDTFFGTFICPAANTDKSKLRYVADFGFDFDLTTKTGSKRTRKGKVTVSANSEPFSCIDDGTPPKPECSDGVDNDADGKIDFPADPDCANADDITEAAPPVPECDDGKDNDGDGKIDHPDDPECDSPFDTTEAGGGGGGGGGGGSNPDPSGLACTGAELLSPEEGGIAVEVVKFSPIACFLKSHLTLAGPDACDYPHWHATRGDNIAYRLDGSSEVDPAPGVCGFGMDMDSTTATLYIKPSQKSSLDDLNSGGGGGGGGDPEEPEDGTYSFSVSFDPDGHEPFVGMPASMTLTWTISGGTMSVSGSSSTFVPVSGSYDPDTGAFSLSGSGTVAGMPGKAVSLTGTWSGGSLSGVEYSLGTSGGLPGGKPIKFTITKS